MISHPGSKNFKEFCQISGWDGSNPAVIGWSENPDWDHHGGTPFPGKIDDIRVYDYTLSRSEIMYLAGVSGTVYVPLDDWRADIDDDDRVDLTDYSILADNWLDMYLWPEP